MAPRLLKSWADAQITDYFHSCCGTNRFFCRSGKTQFRRTPETRSRTRPSRDRCAGRRAHPDPRQSWHRTRVAERLAASGIFVTSSTTPNLYLAELPRPRLSIVTSDPDVVRVSLDAPVRALGTLSSLPQNLLLGTQALLPRTYTGKNIGVAVVDSGFLTSADLGNVTASYDFTSGKTVKAGPKDAFGHGTHVSGLIGSTGDTTRGLYQGIAPGVRFIVLKALDQAGVGYTSNVINAINFAVDNKVRSASMS